MAVERYPLLERLSPLIELQIHQIARKTFHYHDVAMFPYNLLITVLSGDDSGGDHFYNCESGQTTHLKVGHAYLLPCHLPIRYERTPAYTVVTMRFNLTFFHGLDIFDGTREVEDMPDSEFAARLASLLDQENPDYLKNALALKTEVARLCLSRWPDHLREVAPAMWKYEEVLLYARGRIDATLTVDKLAKRYGLRQDVFSRSFTRDVGVAPKQYLNDMLVRKISGYLLTTQLSVKEIAEELGFSSQYYLSRFFKKHTNLSPREYRDQLLDKSDD